MPTKSSLVGCAANPNRLLWAYPAACIGNGIAGTLTGCWPPVVAHRESVCQGWAHTLAYSPSALKPHALRRRFCCGPQMRFASPYFAVTFCR